MLPRNATVLCGRLAGSLVRLQRFAERLEQLSVDRVALRIVLGMPLDTEREARGVRDPDRLDGAVFGDAFDDDARAGFEDALPVQRIHPDGLAAEQAGKRAAGREVDVVAARL